MHKYDYTFLKDDLIPPTLLNAISRISELKGQFAFKRRDYIETIQALEEITRVQSIRASNAIEDIIFPESRLFAVINGGDVPQNSAERDLAGYRDAYEYVQRNFEHIEITEKELLNLHSILVNYHIDSAKGVYKTKDNYIMGYDSFGRRTVRFYPPLANEVYGCMKELFAAYHNAHEDKDINSLLLIPCFIHDLLCIHPFNEFNGRISRLLTHLLLFRLDYEAPKYISFDDVLLRDKSAYLKAVNLASYNWHSSSNNYWPIIEHFITSLVVCYEELDRRLVFQDGKKISKSLRISDAIMKSTRPISKMELVEFLGDVSPTTVERVLAELLSGGKIIKVGSNKNAHYFKGRR